MGDIELDRVKIERVCMCDCESKSIEKQQQKYISHLLSFKLEHPKHTHSELASIDLSRSFNSFFLLSFFMFIFMFSDSVNL